MHSLLVMAVTFFQLSTAYISHLRPLRLSSNMLSTMRDVVSIAQETHPPDDSEEPLERPSPKRKKLRQHVNPLAAQHQTPVKLADDWVVSSFANPALPFVIDVGCAKGGWPLQFAQSNPHLNVLGLEIREPCVAYALRRKAYWKVPNVHFLSLNANVDLNRIFMDIKRTSDVDLVTIQFPDPHFKARHKKRRVVNESFVSCIAENLSPEKRVFIQSDILEVSEHMVECFSDNPRFLPCEGYDSKAMHVNLNPTGILTEREIATLAKPGDVYRMLFKRI